MPKIKEKRLNITPAQEIKILRRIVEITNSSLDLNRILGEMVNVVNDMTHADSVFIYLFDEKKRYLVLMASKIPHQKELGSLNLKIGEGITGWVAKENKPVVINNKAYLDPRFKNLDVLREDKYEAFLSVPIVCNGDCIGVINVQHKKSHEYAMNTVNLISIIAKQTGGVIVNARLYEDKRRSEFIRIGTSFSQKTHVA